jgi:hypothetical protein
MKDQYNFGVEIELIAEPLQVHDPLRRCFYYKQLAEALKSLGLRAKADKLTGGYRKHREHYNKWWITKDGSLGDPPYPQSTT